MRSAHSKPACPSHLSQCEKSRCKTFCSHLLASEMMTKTTLNGENEFEAKCVFLGGIVVAWKETSQDEKSLLRPSQPQLPTRSLPSLFEIMDVFPHLMFYTPTQSCDQQRRPLQKPDLPLRFLQQPYVSCLSGIQLPASALRLRSEQRLERGLRYVA